MIIIIVMATAYLFNTFLLSIYYGLDPVLGAGDSSMNKTDKYPSHMDFMFYICSMPRTELNITGPFSFAPRATLKGEGIISSSLLLWEIRQNRVT